MKFNRLFVLSLMSVFVFSSCTDLMDKSKIKGGEVPNPNTVHTSNNGRSNKTVNDWIYENMDFYYLWGDKMTKKELTQSDLQPDEYFQSILYQYGVVDRFSWIEEDAVALKQSLQGISKSSGFSYTPFRIASGSDDLILAVRYTIKDSPAEKSGLDRGHLITKINGTTITVQNYQSLLGMESLTLTLGEWSGNTIVSTDKTIKMEKEVIQNFPVHYSDIINWGNKKVGYLVYNQFIPGTSANPSLFDNQLREIFGEFKSNGVTELVVDLRFNGGGYISSSEVLSSLIVKDLKPGTLMNRQVWSNNVYNYFKNNGVKPEDYFDSLWPFENNNLGNLDRVFFLVSGGTASASELVINNLKPFMDVILIGDNTYGKDVGSITVDDEDNDYRWKWGLQPIVLRTVNSEGRADYGTVDGFTPDFKVNDNVIPFRPFGDPDETLLRVALQVINPNQTATAQARVAKTYSLPSTGLEGGSDNPINNRKDMFIDFKNIINK